MKTAFLPAVGLLVEIILAGFYEDEMHYIEEVFPGKQIDKANEQTNFLVINNNITCDLNFSF